MKQKPNCVSVSVGRGIALDNNCDERKVFEKQFNVDAMRNENMFVSLWRFFSFLSLMSQYYMHTRRAHSPHPIEFGKYAELMHSTVVADTTAVTDINCKQSSRFRMVSTVMLNCTC